MAAISDRVVEVRQMAEQLRFFLPPPARNPIADKLHGLGFRLHPDLATLVLKVEGPASMGQHAPASVISKTADEQGMDALRSVDPVLAAKIDAAHANRDIIGKIQAAKTDAEKVQLARELGINVPDDVFAAIADLKEQVDALSPEDFE